MNGSIASNLRPLLRAFYTFLISIAALWGMATIARGQLYIGSTGSVLRGFGPGQVAEYNAATGEAINANLITGLNAPVTALALQDNTLFVAVDSGFVSKYDATTGAVISPGFITGLVSPSGLAVEENTLFVSDLGRVSTYDATTGAAIDLNFITRLDFNPQALVVQGNTLFIAEDHFVGKYDASTGETIDAHFITTPIIENIQQALATKLALQGNTLFVALHTVINRIFPDHVGEYNAKTGEAILFPIPTVQFSSIAVQGGKLFAAQSIVQVIDPKIGQLINQNLLGNTTLDFFTTALVVKSAK